MNVRQLTIATAAAALILSGCSDNSTSNTPPVVQIDAEQNVKSGQPLQLNANASDADGSVVSYVWKEGENVLATTESFTYVSDVPGVHTLVLTVTDDRGASQTQSFTVIVSAPNQLPVANAGEDRSAVLGETLTLVGSGSDTDGNITSYRWFEGDTELSDTATLSYTAEREGVHILTLSVTDNDGADASDEIQIDVHAANRVPTASAGEDIRATVGEEVVISGSGSDSDGTIVSYVWEEEGTVLAHTASLAYIPTSEGTHSLTLTVTDNSGATASDTVIVTAEASTQATLPTGGKPTVVEKKAKQWYIRLVAEDPVRNMKTSGTQLGELEADDAVEKHTLKALTPFGGLYLDIVFQDPDGVAPGEYKVNFHKHEENAEDRWRFTVKTDSGNVNADILLSWKGVYVLTPYTDAQNRLRYREFRSVTNPIIKQMKLVDTVTGEEIPAAVNGEVQTYTFNMNGATSRRFEWVVQENEVVISAKQSRVHTLKRDAKVLYKEADGLKKESFDLSKPPMIKEDMPH